MATKLFVEPLSTLDMRFANRSSPENFIKDSSPPIGAFREKDIVNFTHGYASPEQLPGEKLTQASQRVLSNHENVALQYGPAKGVGLLRETLVEYLASDYHIGTDLDNVMIITGAKQGWDLLCKALIEPGDKVAVTAPTYGTGLKILQSHEADFLPVPVDQDGMVVSALREEIEALESRGEDLPKLIFDVPEFHNPTGVTMSLERRHELIDLVETYDVTFVEDAPYRKLRFEGEEIPPVKSLDEGGNVVFLGTYSKLICPGLRVGWMVAEETIIDRVLPLKEDGGTSPYCQMLIRELHQEGYVAKRAREYAAFLRGQRDATVDAIHEFLPTATIHHEPAGGYYIWIELPEDIDTTALQDVAKEERVRFLPGEVFSPERGSRNFLRLSWAYEDVSNIEEGVRRLSTALEHYQTALA